MLDGRPCCLLLSSPSESLSVITSICVVILVTLVRGQTLSSVCVSVCVCVTVCTSVCLCVHVSAFVGLSLCVYMFISLPTV